MDLGIKIISHQSPLLIGVSLPWYRKAIEAVSLITSCSIAEADDLNNCKRERGSQPGTSLAFHIR